MRLPGQAKARLEVPDAGVGVVSGANRRGPCDEIKIHVLAIIRLTGCCQFVAQAEIQCQVVGNAPVVLPKYPKETVAQILVAAAAVPLLNIVRKTQHEVGDRAAVGSGVVASELTSEAKLACQTGCARK